MPVPSRCDGMANVTFSPFIRRASCIGRFNASCIYPYSNFKGLLRSSGIAEMAALLAFNEVSNMAIRGVNYVAVRDGNCFTQVANVELGRLVRDFLVMALSQL